MSRIGHIVCAWLAVAVGAFAQSVTISSPTYDSGSGGFKYFGSYVASGCPCGEATITLMQIRLGPTSPSAWVNVSPAAELSGEYNNGTFFGGTQRTFAGSTAGYTQFQLRVKEGVNTQIALSSWADIPVASDPLAGWEVEINEPADPWDCVTDPSASWEFSATELSPPDGESEPGFEYPELRFTVTGPDYLVSVPDWNGVDYPLPVPETPGEYEFRLYYIDLSGEIPAEVTLDEQSVTVDCDWPDAQMWVEPGTCTPGVGMVGARVRWSNVDPTGEQCSSSGVQWYLDGAGPEFNLDVALDWGKLPSGSYLLPALVPGSFNFSMAAQPGGCGQLSTGIVVPEDCADVEDPEDPPDPGAGDSDGDGDVWDQPEIMALISATQGTEAGVEGVLLELESQGIALDTMLEGVGLIAEGVDALQGGVAGIENAVEALHADLSADTKGPPEGNTPGDGAEAAAAIAAFVPDLDFVEGAAWDPFEIGFPTPPETTGGEWGEYVVELQVDPRGWNLGHPVYAFLEVVRGTVRSLLVALLGVSFVSRILGALRQA